MWHGVSVGHVDTTVEGISTGLFLVVGYLIYRVPIVAVLNRAANALRRSDLRDLRGSAERPANPVPPFSVTGRIADDGVQQIQGGLWDQLPLIAALSIGVQMASQDGAIRAPIFKIAFG